ncbi:unnamed protein product [Symbiodinium sp. CCMP2592]|nr:unnamed protein product [Symbiodinium sp. CCMP2592]
MADEIAADVAMGRMEGPFEVGLLAPSRSQRQVGSDGKDKIRRAEDWRSSGANDTVGVPDTPAYHGIDAFVHLARAVRSSSHPRQGGLRLWGLDHEAAYRQLPVEDPSHTFVVLNTPQGPTLWKHNVLLFGSTASVWGYCRVADLMTWMPRCMLLSPNLHFVDDFGSVETQRLAHSCFRTTQTLCAALGLKFKDSKKQPPAQQHQLQGVSLSLGDLEATVAITPERARRIDNQLKEILLNNRLAPREASSLAGKLQFVSQSLFGQASAAALRPIYKRARGACFRSESADWQLTEGLKEALEFLRLRLRDSKPRVVRYEVAERAVIYADAFFELEGKRFKPSEIEDVPSWGNKPPAAFTNGWGFVARVGERTFFAAGSVPFWFARHFASKRSYIYMLEIIAQIVPLIVLSEVVPPHLLLFIDNEPARHALTKGFGNCRNLNKLLQVAWSFTEKNGWWPVWQRVASSANASDGVSRFDFSLAREQNWEWCESDYDAIFHRLLSAVNAFPFQGL